MARGARRNRESLAQCYGSALVRFSLRPNVSLCDLWTRFLARSPIHFQYGDMRREYGWTKALVTAALSVGALGLAVRALLTGLFVAFVTSDLPFVLGFNLCLTVLVGRWLLTKGIHPRERHQPRIRTPRRPTDSRRQSRRSSTTIDRL